MNYSLTNILPDGFNGYDTNQRKMLKVEGSKQCKEGKNLEDKVQGAIKMLYSYFCRSEHSARLAKRKHTDYFATYVGHWLYVNVDYFVEQGTFNNEIKQELIDYYYDVIPTNDKKAKIKYGSSYYNMK